MKKEEFDRLFDLALEDAAKKLPSPDPDLSWMKIEDRFRRTKMRSPSRWISYSAMVASFLLGALIFSLPAVSNAFNPLVAAVKELQENVVSFVFGKNSENEKLAKTDAPPEGEIVTESFQQTTFSSWEEAKHNLAFHAPDIGYVPESYKLEQIILFTQGSQKAELAVLLYFSDSDYYQIYFETAQSKKQIATGSENIGSKYEEILINGQKAYMFTDSKGRRSLELIRGPVVISISGTLSDEELQKIASGIS